MWLKWDQKSFPLASLLKKATIHQVTTMLAGARVIKCQVISTCGYLVNSGCFCAVFGFTCRMIHWVKKRSNQGTYEMKYKSFKGSGFFQGMYSIITFLSVFCWFKHILFIEERIGGCLKPCTSATRALSQFSAALCNVTLKRSTLSIDKINCFSISSELTCIIVLVDWKVSVIKTLILEYAIELAAPDFPKDHAWFSRTIEKENCLWICNVSKTKGKEKNCLCVCVCVAHACGRDNYHRYDPCGCFCIHTTVGTHHRKPGRCDDWSTAVWEVMCPGLYSLRNIPDWTWSVKLINITKMVTRY